ncbi:MAG: ABC transporter ATP-binding protein [Alkalispirochaeta sp.]
MTSNTQADQSHDYSSTAGSRPLLQIKDLHVVFDTDDGVVHAVEGAGYDLYPGETLAVVGESGAGKSVTAHSVLGLVPRPPGRLVSGNIMFDGSDLARASEAELRRIRGRRISMVFQEPMTSLNPVHTVGKQIMEPMLIHRVCNPRQARRRALDLLRKVGIAAPEQRMREYPHQLSGGMRQRVMIAIALACEPQIIIADEPTSALDVTVQLQILRLLKNIQEQMGLAVILITHDLGVVAEVADRVVVMYAGRVVEAGSVHEIFSESVHPYVAGLRRSIPNLEKEDEWLQVIPGQVPDASDLPPGCPFAPRCEFVMDRCRSEDPPTTVVESGHTVRCWLNGGPRVEEDLR